MSTSEAMGQLREAIVEMVAEDLSIIDEMTEATENVVDAWNKVCEASPTVGIPEPITPEDIENAFEGGDWEPNADHTED